MNWNEFKQKVEHEIIIKLNDKQVKQFETYKQYLQEQNKLFNLTRLDSDELIYDKYFFQAIIPFIGLELNNQSLLDIGSGSGNPGIILKILFPQMRLTIIESNNKRVEFMKQLSSKLGFNDIEFLAIRAEELPKQYYNLFDIVTSRAVSNLATLIEISCQPTKIGGLIIEPKSANYQKELDIIKNKLGDYGVELLEIKEYDYNNTIISFKKTKNPLNIYPRQWKDIIKEYKE